MAEKDKIGASLLVEGSCLSARRQAQSKAFGADTADAIGALVLRRGKSHQQRDAGIELVPIYLGICRASDADKAHGQPVTPHECQIP